MGLASMLIHPLVIERATAGAEDAYGMPAQTWATLSTVRGLVQPVSAREKATRELAQLSQGGPVVSDHTVFLLPTDIREADRIRMDPDDGRRWQIDAVRDAAGIGHHLELDAHLVEAS